MQNESTYLADMAELSFSKWDDKARLATTYNGVLAYYIITRDPLGAIQFVNSNSTRSYLTESKLRLRVEPGRDLYLNESNRMNLTATAILLTQAMARRSFLQENLNAEFSVGWARAREHCERCER